MTDVEPEDLVHDSHRPSRSGLPGEVAFLTGWQDFIAQAEVEENPLYRPGPNYASPLEHPTQEDATLAGTFMQWLGTNAGACFISLARSFQRPHLSTPDAYLAAWSVQNKRRIATSSELRALESMMVPTDAERSYLSQQPLHPPVLSARQYELAEQLAQWLGSIQGQAFLKDRERELEAFGAHRHALMRESNRSGKALPMHGPSVAAVEDFLRMIRRVVAYGRAGVGDAA